MVVKMIIGLSKKHFCFCGRMTVKHKYDWVNRQNWCSDMVKSRPGCLVVSLQLQSLGLKAGRPVHSGKGSTSGSRKYLEIEHFYVQIHYQLYILKVLYANKQSNNIKDDSFTFHRVWQDIEKKGNDQQKVKAVYR